jgi:hypothetical protein
LVQARISSLIAADQELDPAFNQSNLVARGNNKQRRQEDLEELVCALSVRPGGKCSESQTIPKEIKSSSGVGCFSLASKEQAHRM